MIAGPVQGTRGTPPCYILGLKHYPIFLQLKDRQVLMVGAGKVALRKTKGLLEAGARVTVVAPEHEPEFHELPVRLISRRFRATDLAGVMLVFAATDDRQANHRIGIAAKGRGVFANIADSGEECDFIVPARVSRGAVQIAVSTGGENPRLSAELRRKLEEVL
jgi:precorrin-2 dehydrogenase/sirohydrochlorin ferrochelatase